MMLSLLVACLVPSEDTGPQLVTVTPECPAETRLALEVLGLSLIHI